MRVARLAAYAAAAAACIGPASTAHAQLMIVGNDQKPGLDSEGKPTQAPPGKDTVSIIDMSKPATPRIVATIPVDNTVIGPPTNLAISPSRDIALVANSINPVKKDDKYVNEPDNRIFVIDLTANPPMVAGTLAGGKQPSGMAIAPDGKWALVCNRAEGTVSVLSIDGKDVKITDTVTVGNAGDSVSAVAIAPDGRRALVAKAAANAIAILAIDNGKVTYNKDQDLPTGIYPYNVVIAPNGKLALTADNGNHGTSDGNADSIGVIDLEGEHPHVIDHITVGDSPEGLAISPKGNIAVAIEARGSNQPKAWYHERGGAVTVLKIAGKKVTRAGEVRVGVLPEGAVFSADGSYLYVGNFLDSDLTVLTVKGTQVTDTGKNFKLPGQPASMRGGPQ